MNAEEMRAVLADVRYREYEFVIGGGERLYLQASYMDHDISTNTLTRQFTRKWYVSIHATRSELVQTVLKCCLASAEHRVREGFKYLDRSVYSPHYDVDALWELKGKRENLDYREDQT